MKSIIEEKQEKKLMIMKKKEKEREKIFAFDLVSYQRLCRLFYKT